ncbi:MAG: hypothetical protein V3V05_04770 [Pontiella sp.]
MKSNKQTNLAVVLCVLTVSVYAAPVIEEPAVMPEAMLSVTVSDLHGLIDEVGIIASQVSPMMNGMMLKNLLGMQLGDPNLAGIAPGKGLAIVALDATNFFAVIEVSEAQSAAYTSMASSQGLQANYTNGVLVLAKTPTMLTKGAAFSGKVQSSLLAKRSPTLRVAGQPAAIIERNNDQIQGFLQMIPMMMGASMMQAPGANTNSIASTTKIIEGEVRVLLSIVSQCESGELVLAPQGGSIRLSETYVPKAGTRLAKLGEAAKTSNPNPKIQAGLIGDGGMVQLDFVLGSPDALADFIVAEMESLDKEMGLELDLAGLSKNVTKWTKLYAGAGCEIFDFNPDDGMNVNYLLEIADEAAALELLKTMKTDVAPLMKLYEDAGMPMTFSFKENVSEYKGIKLHRLEIEISLEDMPEEQREQMDALDMDDMDYDIAIFDGLMLYTTGEDQINKSIDRIKGPASSIKPLAARGIYPEGGFYYADLDIGRYVEMVSAMMPKDTPNPIQPQLMAMMQGVDPITSAGFRDAGRVMWSVNIPGDLIGKLGQLGMMMQMQKMQQQQMPQGVPAAMPVQ